MVEDKNLSPITPLEQGQVLQFPYNDSKESSKKVAKALINMVATGGLEPPTPAL